MAPPAGASEHGSQAGPAASCRACCWWFPRGVLVLGRQQASWGLFLSRSICLKLLTQFPPPHTGLLGVPLRQEQQGEGREGRLYAGLWAPPKGGPRASRMKGCRGQYVSLCFHRA